MKPVRKDVTATLSAEELTKLRKLAHAFGVSDKRALNICVKATYDVYNSILARAAGEHLKKEQEAGHVEPESDKTDSANAQHEPDQQ